MIINNFATARHLSARLEIGVDKTRIKSRIGQSLEQVLASMIPPTGAVSLPAPVLTPWSDISVFYSSPIDIRREFRMQAKEEDRNLTAWWLQHICQTEFPLLERMTLFWHNHFTSNTEKVIWPQFMYRQNQLLRRHALGNFADLLREIVRDPAMLVYLDGIKNVKDNPNENFARELLELFTLGEGHYSEADIVEVARAFTGWSVSQESGEFLFREDLHDADDKVFMGQLADLNGDDIVEILLQEPRTAEYIAEKFWAEFINHATPDPLIINAWANEFRDSGYDIATLLHQVIHSEAFWDLQNRGALIKSPVEFSLGLLRDMQLDLEDYNVVRTANKQLGQDLFHPPDVKGWRGGSEWITNTRLIRRYDLITKLLNEHSGQHQNMLEANIVQPMMDEASTSRSRGMFRRLINQLSCSFNQEGLAEWLLPVAPVSEPDCQQAPADIVLTLLKDPTYQLR